MKARSAWRLFLVVMTVVFFLCCWGFTADWQAAIITTAMIVALVRVVNRTPPEDRKTPY